MSSFEPFYRSLVGINWHRRDNGDGTVSYMAAYDSEPILDQNKVMANHNDGYNAARDMRRVASIPMALILKWKEEEGWDAFDPECEAKLAQKLNDLDYLHLRTAPGVLGVSNGVMR